MSRFVKFAALTLIVIAGVMTAGYSLQTAAQDKQATPGEKFLGVPRDIDFLKSQDLSQIIIQGKAPKDDLIAQTKNDGIQSVLLVALSLKSEVVVNFVEDKPNPKKLTSVSLSVNAKEEQGQLFNLSFDEKDSYCRATVFSASKKVKVWTKSPRMQGILETAARQSIPVQEFSFDEKTFEITRGKVNVEVRK
jgi:hypothetical protein